MNILKETSEPQNLDYTPEVNGVSYILITDESTKVTQEIYVEPQSVSYFERVTATFDLKENHFYSYLCCLHPEVTAFENEVLEDNGTFEAKKCLIDTITTTLGHELTIVYKGRIYCTNQETEDYRLLKDEFVEKESNNEFVIYE